MVKVRDVISALEQIAPTRYAFEFDKVGLQVGDPQQSLTRAAVSLDRSLGAVQFCRDNGCQLLVSHHPLIFTPLASVTAGTHVGRAVLELAQNQISFIAAHTNWDSAIGGVNDALAALLGITNVTWFGTAAVVQMSRVAVDAASTPSLKALAEELNFEISCSADSAVAVIRDDLASRVARSLSKLGVCAEISPLRANPEQPAGRIGELASPVDFASFVRMVSERLNTRTEAWGAHDNRIRSVAVVGGAADSEWMNARRAGADVLVTGEVKQHVAVEASESGMCIVAAGHYATEQPGVVALTERLSLAIPSVEWLCFEPPTGLHGRPF